MKTVFTLRIRHEDKKTARNAALSAIELIDKIENKLSRYIAGSDVWQINHMEADQTLFISELTHECLHLSLEAYQKTEGLFDVTLGRLIEHRKNKEDGPAPALSGQLMVVPDRPAIHCAEPGREIDLGGVGKGYALDQAKKCLEEWEIESGILSSGASTHLAFGPQKWTIGLTGKNETREISLSEEALSASGTGIQDAHIVSSTGEETSYNYPRVWVLGDSAAWADIWSTAAMLMPADEMSEKTRELSAIFIENPETGKIDVIREKNVN